MRSRETREEVSRPINLCISNSNALEFGKTHRFIVHLGVTVRSKRSTVTMKRSTMDRFENIVAVGSQSTVWMCSDEMRYKTSLISAVRSRSDALDDPRVMKSRPL